MKFTKMQGIGNDYVYIDCFQETVENPSGLAVKVSDRHFGIGSDGLILIKPSDCADCRMQMFNADGSESEMCGNGIRCVGKYAYDHHIVDKTEMTVETKAGIKSLSLSVEDGRVAEVTVDMGIPRVTSEIPELIEMEGERYEFVGVNMGNPHAVCHTDDVSCLDLKRIGPPFETHERFPEKTNVEFLQVVDRTHMKMRVWERGSGETYACGTGAAASAVASILRGYVDNTVEIELLGGNLTLRWDRDSGHVYMRGPAMEVYHGEFDRDCL